MVFTKHSNIQNKCKFVSPQPSLTAKYCRASNLRILVTGGETND